MTKATPVETNDGFDCFRRLIQQLCEERCEVAAERLDTLLNHMAWTTGNELIGELGLAIRDFQRSRPTLSYSLRNTLKECKKKVRDACGPLFFW